MVSHDICMHFKDYASGNSCLDSGQYLNERSGENNVAAGGHSEASRGHPPCDPHGS